MSAGRPTYVPIFPPPNRQRYDAENEAQFRTVVERYLRGLGQGSVLTDPSGTGAGTAGTYAKWTGAGSLGNATMTETATLATLANALHVNGATTLASTVATTGVVTCTADVKAAVDGTPVLGARATSRFGSAYLHDRVWVGTTPTTTTIGQGLDSTLGIAGTAWSAHIPDYGFGGWEYGTAGAFTLGVTTSNQAEPGTQTVIGSMTSGTVWARDTTTLQDDNFTHSVLFYDCGFNISNQICGIAFLLGNTGTDYQVGHGLSLMVGVKTDGTSDTGQYFTGAKVTYFYRDVSGTIVDAAVVGTLSGSVTKKMLLSATVSGSTVSVYAWKGTGTPSPSLLGSVTMSAAAIAALRDGAHQRVGVVVTQGNAGANPWNFTKVTYASTSIGNQTQADGFAAYLNAPASGSYAEGGGLYVANHSTASLTASEGILVDDQVGAATAYALRTKRGLVQFQDATTLLSTLSVGSTLSVTGATSLASTLGVTGAITGSSTVSGTTLTASTSVVSPLYGTISAVDVVLQRNSVTQLTLASLAATFAGTVQGTRLISTIATGTAPLTVTSTTLVSNLNADYLSGQHGSYYAPLASITGTQYTLPLWATTSTFGNSLLSQDSGATTLTNSGLYVIGTDPGGSSRLRVQADNTNGTYRFDGIGTFGPTAVNTSYLMLLWGTPAGANGLHPSLGTQANGLGICYTIPSNATASSVGFGVKLLTQAASFNAGTIISQWMQSPFLGAGSSVTTLFGFRADNQSISGVTTSYAYYAAAQSGGTTAYAFYSAGAGDNVLGDKLYALTDNSYDFGQASSHRFRTGYFGTSVSAPILVSTVAIGTAPLTVTSTTLVANLHAAVADTSTTQTANNNSTSIATTAYVDRTSGATSSTTAAPTLTTSTTGVMMGLAVAFTPTCHTKAHVTITGAWANSVVSDGIKVQIRYGTGSAPANGAALTGTTAGSLRTLSEPAAAKIGNFALSWVITGLSIGTAYWVDVGLAAVTGGNATITGVDTVITEQS